MSAPPAEAGPTISADAGQRDSLYRQLQADRWDSWRIDVGAGDLAYMMAVHWYPDRRRRYEQALLDRYHASLMAHGVQGYDRRALSEDYRLCALWLLAWPVMQQAYGIAPMIWWNNLEHVMMAVDDLGCLELLSQ